MAIFRNVNMSFWTDSRIVDDFTPEDKYFMLYALTNNYTNIIGCYEISIKQMSNDLGYNKDTVETLLKRFKEIHKIIEYDEDTKELYIKNWSKYNWSTSPKLDNPLFTAIEKIKSNKFHDELAKIYNNRESVKDMVLIPYRYGMDTTITITSTIPITSSITNSININNVTKKIISRLNELTGSSFRPEGKATKDLIKQLLKTYTVEDILMVVDKMCFKWGKDSKMCEYLRPSTLFRRSNFENYYGMPVQINSTKDIAIDTKDFFD